MPGSIIKKSGLDLSIILKILSGLAAAIPLLLGYIEYKKSVEENQNKNFREIVAHLSSKEKTERLASATNLGTFIKREGFLFKTDNPYKDEAKDTLINMLLIESDADILQAVGSSLKRVDPDEYSELAGKLLLIDTTAFTYQDTLKYKLDNTKNLNKRQSKIYNRYKNFKEYLAPLISKEKAERLAGATILDNFLKYNDILYTTDNPYKDEAINILVNILLNESDTDILQAINSSLKRVDPNEYPELEGLIDKLRDVTSDSLKNKSDSTKNLNKDQSKADKGSEEKTPSNMTLKSQPLLRMNASEKEQSLKITLENDSQQAEDATNEALYKSYQARYEENLKQEKDLEEQSRKNIYRQEYLSKFIINFLSISRKYPIKGLELYQNSWNYGLLSGLQLPNIKIKLSAITSANIYKVNFTHAQIEDSTFDSTRIKYSTFQNSEIKDSLFDRVISLKGTKFNNSTFTDVFFVKANVAGADFRGVKGLEPMNFFNADNWKQAKFDEEFKRKLEERNIDKMSEAELKNYKEEIIKYVENSNLVDVRIQELKEDINSSR